MVRYSQHDRATLGQFDKPAVLVVLKHGCTECSLRHGRESGQFTAASAGKALDLLDRRSQRSRHGIQLIRAFKGLFRKRLCALVVGRFGL